MKNKWILLELRCDLFEFNFEDLIKKCGLVSRIVVENIALFEEKDRPNSSDILQLEEAIFENILNNNPSFEMDPDEEILELKLIECDEFIFDLVINDDDLEEEKFIDFLQVFGRVHEYDLEHVHFENLEYSFDSSMPLIHDIRMKNVAIFCLDMLYGICFVGYMKRETGFQVRIKTFQYDIVKTIIDKFSENFGEITFKDNLKWNRLLNRKISSGYRTTDSFIAENDLMKQFLKTTKNTESAENMMQLLSKLCGKGYVSEKEYSDLSHDKNIGKFLLPFYRIDKNHLSNMVWFGLSTGTVYKEQNKTDPKRIQQAQFTRIFSTHHDLLYYIRSYWHQHFVEEALIKIQSSWNESRYALQIIDIKIDHQFDLLSEKNAQNATRDIDCLLLVRNIEMQKDYIIPIESKRNSKEFNKVTKETVEKISSTYCDIFDGFIVTSYFNKESEENISRTLSWACSQKKIILCVENVYSKFINKLQESIKEICEVS
ncbi:hypothetical protein ABE504_31495 [Paenibacillus oryzisoli]|uniref:hypothetical protein n=1 Tax=Paenibacillus oryzisoli TaxID=1850517 RepID=UPI003D26F75D